MRKNYALLKQYGFALTLLLITTFFIHSCKKDIATSNPELNRELINESRIYFQDSILNQSALNDNNLRHELGKKPEWNKAFVKKISTGDAVVVPIEYEYDIFIKENNAEHVKLLGKTSYLIIWKDIDKHLHAEWVTLIPMLSNSKDRFVGIIEVEEWNGKFKHAIAVAENGNQRAVYLSESLIYRKISNSTFFGCITVNHYGSVGVSGYEETKYLGSETFCFGSGGGGSWTEDAPDLRDGGGGPGAGDYTSMYDCNGDLNGSAIIDDKCGCIGGNTGVGECPKEIKDSVKNACIKNALSLALAKNAVNDIKTLFYNSFGSNKNYNVVFNDGSLNSNLDAKTSTKPDDKGIMTSTITFNTDVAGIRSEQYAVATIYHEMVHAELRKLFSEDSQGKILVPYQHEYMGQNFVDKITASLKSVFPSLSDADAWALSWGGLKQTSFFDLLSDGNKTTIGETLMKYSDKDRSDKLGSYCNN